MRQPFIYKKFETRESLEGSLLDTLGTLFMEATAEKPYAVMLSGGSTPAGLYRRIAESGIQAGGGLYLLLSDERIVPQGSPDANRSLLEPMAEAIDLPPERLILVNSELSPEAAAAGYNDALTELNAKGISRKAALLGIGGDGHTASLFSVDAARKAHTTLVEPVAEHAGFERVTTTPEEILTYRRLIFFAAGEQKRDILASLLETPQHYPAGVIASRHGGAELWTDVEVPGAGS
jgi:6-phosphogluconolactonase/glucosamine-6-phosphate isomerase/deaminase